MEEIKTIKMGLKNLILPVWQIYFQYKYVKVASPF